ncbi:MAG: hypothetical protein FWB74_02470 [Defluviitaleaceae bacterium]|nr:hypothetical protein [Defluviitaleaceae bacterium]
MTVAVAKIGDSPVITLPKSQMESLGLKENDRLSIVFEDNVVAVKRKRKTLEERYEEFYGVDFETAIRENPFDVELVDWGPPVGDEIW